jgi:hypothetical protein
MVKWTESYDDLIMKLSLCVEPDWTFDEDDLEDAISTTFGYDDRTIKKYKDNLIKMEAIEKTTDGEYRLNMGHPKIKSLGIDELI